MERTAPARTVLFLLAATALVATAIAFRSSPGQGEPAGATGASGLSESSALTATAGGPEDTIVRAQDLMSELRRRRAAVKLSARRFLAAFLRYEVGDLSPPVRGTLRAGTTPSFYRRLLNHPPRPPATGNFPPRATLRRLDVAFVSSPAAHAVVSGTAQRGRLGEEFSFVFVHRRSGWLASEPGE